MVLQRVCAQWRQAAVNQNRLRQHISASVGGAPYIPYQNPGFACWETKFYAGVIQSTATSAYSCYWRPNISFKGSWQVTVFNFLSFVAHKFRLKDMASCGETQNRSENDAPGGENTKDYPKAEQSQPNTNSEPRSKFPASIQTLASVRKFSPSMHSFDELPVFASNTTAPFQELANLPLPVTARAHSARLLSSITAGPKNWENEALSSKKKVSELRLVIVRHTTSFTVSRDQAVALVQYWFV